MKLALAFLFASTAALTACGDPSCDEAARHAVKIMSKGMGGAGYGGSKVDEDEVRRAATECKEEKWSADLRNCIVGASDMKSMRQCERFVKK